MAQLTDKEKEIYEAHGKLKPAVRTNTLQDQIKDLESTVANLRDASIESATNFEKRIQFLENLAKQAHDANS